MEADITQMYKALKDFDGENLLAQIQDQNIELQAPLQPLYSLIEPSEAEAQDIKKSLSEMILKIQHNLEKLPGQGVLYEHRERQKQIIQVKILKVLSVDKGNEQAAKAMESVFNEMTLRFPDQRPQLMPYLEVAHHIIQNKEAKVQSDRQLDLLKWLNEPNQQLPENLEVFHFLYEKPNEELSNFVKLPYAYLFSHHKNAVAELQAEAAIMILLQRSFHGDTDARTLIQEIWKNTWHNRPTTDLVGTRLHEAVQMLDPKNTRTLKHERDYRQELKSVNIQSWYHELQQVENIQVKNAQRSMLETHDKNPFKHIIEWAGHTVGNTQGFSQREFEFALKTLFIHSTNKPDGISENLAFQKLMLAQGSLEKQPSKDLYMLRMISETMRAVTDLGAPKKLTNADIDALVHPPLPHSPPAASRAERPPEAK